MSIATPRITVEVAFDSDFVDTPVWTDLTSQWIEGESNRGRPTVIDRFEAGECSLLFHDPQAKLHPANASSPYAGKLKPRKRVRVTAEMGNFVPEADMEVASFTKWAAYNVNETAPALTVEGTIAYGGTKSAKVVVGTPNTGRKGLKNANLPGVLRAGVKHRIRFRWRATAGSRNIAAELANVTGTAYTTTLATQTVTHDGTTWQTYEVEFTPSNPLGASSLVELRIYTTGTSFTFYVDEVQIEQAEGSSSAFSATGFQSWRVFTGFTDRWLNNTEGRQNIATLMAVDAFNVLARSRHRQNWYESESIDLAPTHFWRLNDEEKGEGAPVQDIGGDASGTYHASPQAVDGVPYIEIERGATQFVNDAGDTGGWVELPSSTAPTTDNWTIAFWFRGHVPGGGDQELLSTIYASTAPGFFTILDKRFNFQLVDGVGVGFGFYSESEELVNYSNPDFVSDKQWHHAAARVYKSGATYFADTYIDGVLQSTRNLSAATLGWSIGMTPVALWAGRYLNTFTYASMSNLSLYDVALSGADITHLYEMGNYPYGGQYADERIDTLLDLEDWPAADRTLDAGMSTMLPQPLSESTLTQIQRAAETDFGAVFIGADGNVVFRNRLWFYGEGGTADVVLDDAYSAGSLQLSDPGTIYEDKILNRAERGIVGGPVYVVEDSASIDEFGQVTTQNTELLLEDDEEAFNQATYIVGRWAQPEIQIERVTINPRANFATAAAAFGLDLTDHLEVRVKPPGFSSQIIEEVAIERIQQRFSRKEYRTSWFVSTVDPTPYLTLDDPVLGTLDNNALAY